MVDKFCKDEPPEDASTLYLNHGLLTDERQKYVDAIDNGDPSAFNELLDTDQEAREQEHAAAETPNDRILPLFKKTIAESGTKLNQLACGLGTPSNESRDSVQPKFCIYPYSEKFKRTIFTYDLASPKAATKIELPEELGVDFYDARML